MKSFRFIFLSTVLFSNICAGPVLFVYGPETDNTVYSRKIIKYYVQTLDKELENFKVFPAYNNKILSKKSIHKFYKQHDDLNFEFESKILSLYNKSLKKVTIIVIGNVTHFVQKMLKYFETNEKKYIGSLIFINIENEIVPSLGLYRDIKRVQVDELGNLFLIKDNAVSYDRRIEGGDIADNELSVDNTEKDSAVILNSDDIYDEDDSANKKSCCSIWFTPKRVDSVIKLVTLLLKVITLLED